MRIQNNKADPRVVLIGPDEALELLQANTLNRPLNEQHVKRLAAQIVAGKWKFNGDTMKRSRKKDILDGQHRLWAIIEAKMAIETIMVDNIDPDAFGTIDTLRKPRSGSDMLSLLGCMRHRGVISMGLQWLIRWQRKTLENYHAPSNRIENSDIEDAYKANPGMVRAAERVTALRGLCNPSIMAFFYFVLTNRNPDLAERMISTLEKPAGVSVNDPYFRLRVYFTNDDRKDPLTTIALLIKASNAAHLGRDVKALNWRNQGTYAEDFPKLDVGHFGVKVV